MKIIIIGGGIAGCSLYLHLLEHLPVPPPCHPPHEVLIYESHKPLPSSSSTPLSPSQTEPQSSSSTASANLTPSTATIGGGLALAPNGMRILARLSATLHSAVLAQGFANASFIFRAARGWRLSGMPCTDPRVPGEACVSMSRMGLCDVLRSFVDNPGEERDVRDGEGEREGVVRYRKVVEVREGEDRRPGVAFEDGSVESADLVVGADGVRSVVKKGIFGETNPPVYMEQAGIGGFVKGSLPHEVKKEKAMVFTFGGNGFFGYGSSALEEDESLMWWSTYHTPSLPTPSDLSIPVITTSLRKRHTAWKDPVIHAIISSVAGSVSSIYPTWTTPPLPYWGRGGFLLIGDAAHALQPTSGQGASQCLEDGLALSLLLSHYLKQAYAAHAEGPTDSNRLSKSESVSAPDLRAAIDATSSVFYAVREPRVRAISEAAKKMDRGKGEIGVVGEMIVYGFMWLMGKVPLIGRMLIGDVNERLYGWDVDTEVKRGIEGYVPAGLMVE